MTGVIRKTLIGSRTDSNQTQLATQALRRRGSTHYVVPFLFVLCLVVFLAFAATAHSERSVVVLGQPRKQIRLDNDWCRAQGKIHVAILERKVHGCCRYILVGQLCYSRRWRRWKCHRRLAMSKRLCSRERMDSKRTMTIVAVYPLSMQYFNHLRKAANAQIGVNMHGGLKIDAIGMAFVARLWLLIKNVVCRSGAAMMSRGP